MKKLYYIVLLCLLTCFINIDTAFATHIKAADIKVVRDTKDAKKYTFTLFVYYDAGRVGPSGVPVDFATLDFGDKTNQTVALAKPLEIVEPGVAKGTYIFEHQYKLIGNYNIGYTEYNRVDGVLNMSNSVNTPLFIETMISIQPFLGINDSPILTIPPIDNANSGELYTYNTGAYDPNGDSLSFEIIPTKQGVGKEVDLYTSPDDPKFKGTAIAGGPSTFKIDSKTGDITWDTPGQIGIYNIAIRVTEYRAGIKIGFVIRDMQIVVKDGNNKPPVIILPNDTCLVGNGTLQLFNILTTDLDGNLVATNAFGSLISNNKAIFATNSTKPSPAFTQLQWSPTCGDAQDQPYVFNFKAEDFPTANNDKLYDFKSFSIKINAPKPTNFKITELTKAVKLSWDPYNKTCTADKFQDTLKAKVDIFRQTCDSIFTDDDCKQGKSGNLSGELIASVSIKDSVFIDNNNGKGLSLGTYYYYTIKPRNYNNTNGGGAAIAADALGIILEKSVPLIKNVTVTETGTNGKIKISWKKPADTTALTPPYTYTLSKADGLNGKIFTSISTIISNKLLDSFYVDNCNTSNIYLYKLNFNANGVEIGTSETSSNLFISAKATNAQVTINCKFKSVHEIDYFNIYNAKTNTFLKKFNKTNDSSATIDITDLANCDTACFRVESIGRYCVDDIKDSIINQSQIVCDIPKLGSKPSVTIGINESICKNYTCKESFPDAPYTNEIFWNQPITNACDVPKGYNIYYALNQKSDFNLIGTTNSITYLHDSLANFTGCYYVKSINFNDEESEASNIVCQDVCPCFELPNIVTPNDDGLNDLFTPLYPPRFVETVKLTVYNRWGGIVYQSKDINDIYIHWNAKELSDGIYFYHAEVTFTNRANIEDRKKTFKAWVQVAR